MVVRGPLLSSTVAGNLFLPIPCLGVRFWTRCFCCQIEAEEVSRTNEFVQLEFHGQELDDKVGRALVLRQQRGCKESS